MSADVEQRAGAGPVDRDNPAPLGAKRIFIQAKQDLFGTKDVQDAITASYVWLEDEAGHIALGFVFALVLCSIANLFFYPNIPWYAFIAIGVLAFLIGFIKEKSDQTDSKKRWGGVFHFDSHDIDWNVWTALFYYVVGIGLAVSPFVLGWRGPVVAIVIALCPILTVAYWWLQRKLAFQQAGLPYLFRLANFRVPLEQPSIETVCALANFRNSRVPLWKVLLGRSTEGHPTNPGARHILITGGLGAGKTSLCVGIGTEFAFSLKKCRYLSAVKLVELVLGKKTTRPVDPTAQYDVEVDDGRYLWMLPKCDMVIVDDVDVGVKLSDNDAQDLPSHLIHPDALKKMLSLNSELGPAPLSWLGGTDRRSVWVIGNAREENAWREVIAALLGISERDIATVHVAGFPAAAPNAL